MTSQLIFYYALLFVCNGSVAYLFRVPSYIVHSCHSNLFYTVYLYISCLVSYIRILDSNCNILIGHAFLYCSFEIPCLAINLAV